jgi:hypothetical protein
MNRFDGNILSTIAKFTTPEEVFRNASVSKIWSIVMEREKKDFLKKIGHEVLVAHLCDNFCPCFFEKYARIMISYHKPKKMICDYLNNKKNPRWIDKYLKDLEKV